MRSREVYWLVLQAERSSGRFIRAWQANLNREFSACVGGQQYAARLVLQLARKSQGSCITLPRLDTQETCAGLGPHSEMRHVRKSDLDRRFSRHAETDSAALQLIEDQRARHEHGIIERHGAAFEHLLAGCQVEKSIGQSTNRRGFRSFESDFMVLP